MSIKLNPNNQKYYSVLNMFDNNSKILSCSTEDFQICYVEQINVYYVKVTENGILLYEIDGRDIDCIKDQVGDVYNDHTLAEENICEHGYLIPVINIFKSFINNNGDLVNTIMELTI